MGSYIMGALILSYLTGRDGKKALCIVWMVLAAAATFAHAAAVLAP